MVLESAGHMGVEATPTNPMLTLAAWGALATALVLVELNEAGDSFHNVCLGNKGGKQVPGPQISSSTCFWDPAALGPHISQI
jgi:hypothetical protein